MQLYQEFSNDDRPAGTVLDIDPTVGEAFGARLGSSYELNPTVQLKHRADLGSLQAGPTSVTLETGEQMEVTSGLAPDDPRARRLSVEEANEKGKTLGLRFSEPPTQAQYDYLADLKQAEAERNTTMQRASGIANAGLGLLADFAAQAVDPLNIATAFVPVVGEARYLAWAGRYGTNFARLAKGGIEGAAGAAAVTPLVYAQAQDLQQEYGLSDAFMDVVMGTGLGSGLHYAGGKVADAVRAARLKSITRTLDRQIAAYERVRGSITREFAPSNAGDSVTVDWRSLRIPDGELPHIVESLDRNERAKMLGAAVKAMESDNWPKMDELMRGLPEATSVAKTDKRYPAVQRMTSSLTAADLVDESPLRDILDQHLYRTIPGADNPDSGEAFKAVFKHYMGQTKKAKDWSIWIRPDEAYRQEAAGFLEHPDQKAYVDADAKTVVVSDLSSLAAFRHEVERALDTIQGFKGGEAGAYRYRRGDNEGPVIHRKMLSQLYRQDPQRAPEPQVKPESAVDLFSRPEPVMKADDEASQQIWDAVENDKDKDLDTLIKEEEIEVLEDTLRHMQGSARTMGAIERTIPVEERDLFNQEATAGAAKSMASKVESAIQEAVDGGDAMAPLYNSLRNAFDSDPEVVRRWIADEITDEEFDALTGTPPLPPKTPEEGAGAAKADEEDDLFSGIEADVLRVLEGGDKEPTDLTVQVDEMTKAMTPLDAMDMEAKIVSKEQQLLSGNRAIADLFNPDEKAEFDEANSNRAPGPAQGSNGAVRGAGAGAQPAPAALEDGLFATRVGGDGPPAGGKGADIDAERSTPGGERSAPETARSIGLGTVPTRVITPDGSIEVGVEPVIVEWDSLRKAEGRFQPRDRSRKESDANIRERANRLDPEQLMPTRVSDSGPPIITRDGMVISGNGRYATVGQVYDHITLEPQAQRYRERLGPAADGYKKPILVMRITDDIDDESLVKFADRSNRGRIEQMSATEKAQRDVNAAGIDLMMLYQGGDFESRNNREFLQSFMRKVATTTELGEMSKNGRLTKEGYDRLNAAVLAAAYDDTGILSLMLEDADDNIRSITSAYRDVAPEFMKLRAEIGAGVVKEEMDLTPYMMEAARIISEQRRKGVKISEFLAQQDAFDPLDKTVETLIRSYYNKDLTRAVSALRIGEYLTDFVAEARLHQSGGFLPDETGVGDVLGVAERKRESQGAPVNDAEDPTGLLGAEPSPVESPSAVGPAAPESAPARPSGQPVAKEIGGESVTKQPLTVRAAKLESLKGNKAEFDAYVNKLGNNLKKVDLERTAESYLGRILTAKERKTKKTVMDALTSTVKGSEQVQNAPAAEPAEPPVAVENPKYESVAGLQILPSSMASNTPAPELINRAGAERFVQALKDLPFGPAKWLRYATEEVRPPELREYMRIAAIDGLIVRDKEGIGSTWRPVPDNYVERIMAEKEVVQAPPPKELRGYSDLRRSIPDIDTIHLSKKELADMKAWVKDSQEFSSKPLTSMSPADAAAKQRDLVERGDRLMDAYEKNRAEAEEVDAEIAAEEVESAKPDFTQGEHAKFYAYLQGTSPVKNIRTLAKAISVSQETASKLLDHGVDNGWLKLKDDGTYIRVPKKDRPVTPEYSVDFDIDAYHGSPHIFHRFDMTKIGTGEGAQSYGHGLYFAENAMVARDYRIKLAGSLETGEVDGKPYNASNPMHIASKALWASHDDVAKAISMLEEKAHSSADVAPRATAAVKILKAGIDDIPFYRDRGPGAIYKVKIKAQQEDMLDWDVDLNDQMGLLTKLMPLAKKMFPDLPEWRLMNKLRNMSGEAFVKELTGSLGNGMPKNASDMLRDAGIPGIRYFDQGSRSAGSGTRNIVVFDDSLVNITHVNGEPVSAREYASVQSAPKGWGYVEPTEFRTTQDSIITDTFSAAVSFIARNEGISTRQVIDAYGFRQQRDYVDVARRRGFAVPDGYDIAVMQRDLQASLISSKVMMEASRILPEAVRKEMADVIPAGKGTAKGRFMWADDGRPLVTIARRWDDEAGSINTIHHEAVHALRALRLFTKSEWALLERTAIENKWVDMLWARSYVERYNEQIRQQGLKVSEQDILARLTEEAVAREYGKWAAGRAMTEPEHLLFDRIRRFLSELFASAVRYFKGPNAGEIFESIYRGDIAERWSEWNGGRVDDGARNSLRSFSLDERVRDVNAQMKALVEDDSQKIGNAAMRSIEALAPCAAYHL